MISALLVASEGTRCDALRGAILNAANFDIHLTSIQSGEDAVQILRSIRFEIMVVDLRLGVGDDAATKVLELLRNERPEDLDRLLLISDIDRPSIFRGQARMIEGDEAGLQMPNLGRSIVKTMGDIIPEMRAWTA